MSITVKIKQEVEVKTLQVHAHVRYWCDATVNGVEGDDDEPENDLGIPCREGECWCPTIDVATGVIEDWPKGTTASIHYKVCDQCSWSLIGSDGKEVLEVSNEYVPNTLCPKDKGYGDYIIMDIDGDGKIANWRFNPEDFTSYADE